MIDWTGRIARLFVGLTRDEAAELALVAAVPIEGKAISPITGTILGELPSGAPWTVYLDYKAGLVVRVATFQ